jgi:hypothetical protein
LTELGREDLQIARQSPYPDEDFVSFEDEVLSGMDAYGRETQLVNPVVPKSYSQQYHNSQEDKLINGLTYSDLVNDLLQTHPGLALDVIADYWAKGQIVVCQRCGELAIHKSGVNGLAKKCINCQQEARKK